VQDALAACIRPLRLASETEEFQPRFSSHSAEMLSHSAFTLTAEDIG